VFVQDVELVDAPKSFIPTLVRFQVLDEPPRRATGSLYRFARSGFKYLFALPEGEFDVPVARPVGIAMLNDRHHQQVERSACVMDRVAKDTAPLVGNALVDLELPKMLTGVRVSLGMDGIRVASMEELNLFDELPDVAFGPCDL
jgi:hypothetical protein